MATDNEGNGERAITKVYRYGVYWDEASIDRLCTMIARCDDFYNALAREVNKLLGEREAYIAERHPEYARLQAELAFVDRWRNPNFTSTQRKTLVGRLRAALEQYPVDKTTYREADALFGDRWKVVRAGVNKQYRDAICWTHRGALDKAVETAAKGQKTHNAHQARTWGYRVQLRANDGTGTIGGQTFVHAGCAARGIYAFHSATQAIVCIGNGAHQALPAERGARRRAARQPIRVRIAEGIYLSGVITLHRELPKEGRIKEIRLTRRREGTLQRHHILFTVVGIPVEEHGHEVAGYHLGWSSKDEVDDDEFLTAGALALPDDELLLRPPAIAKRTWARELQGATDREQNQLRDWLWHALSARPEIPEHLVHLAKWRSADRLAALADDAALTESERARVRAWVRHHKHRIDAVAGATGDAIETRNQYYKTVVRSMVRRGVGVIALEKGTLAHFSMRDKDEEGRRAQRQRADVAPHVFVAACRTAGLEIIEINPAYTSETCSHCGAGGGMRSRREFSCTECGAVDHEDVNAARNLRALGCEHLRGPQNPPPARKPKKPSRSARFREARERKRELLEVAE